MCCRPGCPWSSKSCHILPQSPNCATGTIFKGRSEETNWNIRLQFLGHFDLLKVIGLQALGKHSASVWIHKIPIRLLENSKLLIFMISGFFNVSLAPKNQLFLSLETPRYLKKTRKSMGDCYNICFLKISGVGKPTFLTFSEKTRAGDDDTSSNKISKIMDIKSISINNKNDNFVIRNKYLLKT